METPPPSEPCPTEEQESRLGDILGHVAGQHPGLADELVDLGIVFIDAGSYCRVVDQAIRR